MEGFDREPRDRARRRRVRANGPNGRASLKALLLLFSAVLAGCGIGARRAERILAEDGAWCWFADPRAIFHEGRRARTYAGWVSSRGDVVVGAFDHETGEVESQVLHAGLERDDHASPALAIAADGRILAFYSKHADEAMRLRVSARPEEIDAWSEERSLRLNDPAERRPGRPNSVCYPNPSRLGGPGDRLVLFWRGTNWKPCVSTSEDGGETWSVGRVAFAEPGAPPSNRPYLKASRDDGGRVHLALTTGHPRNEPSNSVHYARFEDGRFFRADGSLLGTIEDLPIAPSRCDLVYDASATGERAWIWDVAGDAEGRPVVVYARFPAENRHVYRYARWDGARWVDHPVVEAGGWFPKTPAGEREPEPHYSGGIVLDHSDPRTVYLSRRIAGAFEIERRTTRDGGATWDSVPVTSGSQADNVRPVVVRGHRRDGPTVLWMRNDSGYEHYTRFGATIRMDAPRLRPAAR